MVESISFVFFLHVFRVLLGIYHYQYKVVTKSWFEPEPELALPEDKDDENEEIRKYQRAEHEKLIQEVKNRNKKRQEDVTFTEVWYTFVDPYATEVDERGSDDAFRSVGILIFKNGNQRKEIILLLFDFVGRRIVDEYEWKYDNHVPLVSDDKLIIYELHISDFHEKFKDVTAKMDYFVELGVTAGKLKS
jgi:pullulanase/glycogen debranching enzyme